MDWLDAQSACALLGVKAQTLYAYVSRHKIRARTDPNDSRHSLYAKHDIEGLLRKMRRPRARADVARAAIRWGDPVLTTAISEVRDGTLWVRERAIEDCAEQMTFEQMAAVLCDTDEVTCPVLQDNPVGASSFVRAMKGLARDVETAPPMQGQSPAQIAAQAGRLLSVITGACVGNTDSGPLHDRIAAVWGAGARGADTIRRCLVLLSDHELNPSTFAVRVCASTGASLPAALLAGMATLSGPRHGGVADLTGAALRATRDGRLATFLNDNAHQAPYAYGFGHPLYPAGDPRAAHLLARLPQSSPARQAVISASSHLGLPPNIDAALAAVSTHFNWPADAATTLFSIGRTAGWVAHAIEQVSSGEMIRPRARYRSG